MATPSRGLSSTENVDRDSSILNDNSSVHSSSGLVLPFNTLTSFRPDPPSVLAIKQQTNGVAAVTTSDKLLPVIYQQMNLKLSGSAVLRHEDGTVLMSGIPDRPGQRRRFLEYEERLDTFQDGPSPWPRANPSPKYLARIGFIYTGCEHTVQCFICEVEISDWDDGKDPLIKHHYKSPNCSYIHRQFSSELNALLLEEKVVHCSPQYSNSSYRLHTFSDWQHSGIVTSYQLASAGFFYNGRGTRVECFSCGLVYEDWKRGDLPLHVHRRLKPNCPFITSLLKNDSQQLLDPGHCPPTPSDYPASRLPDYSLKTIRLQSFKHLARNFPVGAVDCAEAGLFFLRKPDVMKCFSCGVIVKDWVDGDVPAEKHREANSSCKFLYEMFPTKFSDCSKEDIPIFSRELEEVDPSTLPEPEFDEDDLERMSLQLKTKCKVESSELMMETISPAPLHPVQTVSLELCTGHSYTQCHAYNPLQLPPSMALNNADNTCVICMDAPLEVVLIPCGHMCICESCSRQIVVCPMCRKTVEDTVKVFFPY